MNKRTPKSLPNTRKIVNSRMIKLMKYAIQSGLVNSQKEWCDQIGYNHTNFNQVRNFAQGFTDEQKLAAAKLVDADMNYIFGRTDEIKWAKKTRTGLELIEEGVRILKEKRR